MMQKQKPAEIISDIEDKFRSCLSANGLRYTPERRAILRAIMELDGHFSQNDLLARARKYHAKLNRTTVFRNVPEFERCAIIRRVQAGDAVWRYEHIPGHAHHDHLLCMECGRLIEIESPEIEILQAKICRKYNFTEMKHQLCIQGICAECRGR